jgi:hypothetical protein
MNTLSTCLQENLTQLIPTTFCSFPDCPIIRQKDSLAGSVKKYKLPVKDIYLYPLVKNFRMFPV